MGNWFTSEITELEEIVIHNSVYVPIPSRPLFYPTDTGSRDLKKEIGPIPRTTPFYDVMEMARNVNAVLIVLTSRVNDEKPGAYYIKGFQSKITYEEIKQKLDDNLAAKKFSKRKAWLLP